MKKRLFKVHTYTEYRVFTGLKYLILYGCNAYPKSNHEIASVEAIVYERVKTFMSRFWPFDHFCFGFYQNKSLFGYNFILVYFFVFLFVCVITFRQFWNLAT